MKAKFWIVAMVVEIESNDPVYAGGATVESVEPAVEPVEPAAVSVESVGVTAEAVDEEDAPPTLREGIPRTLRGVGPVPEVNRGR